MHTFGFGILHPQVSENAPKLPPLGQVFRVFSDWEQGSFVEIDT
jgi:hypothetical protein